MEEDGDDSENNVEVIRTKKNETSNEYVDTYLFKCPHCGEFVEVAVPETNCCIFRHGTLKHNLQQVNPHMPQDQCEALIRQDLVFGCCKPFRLVLGEKPKVEICGYI